MYRLSLSRLRLPFLVIWLASTASQGANLFINEILFNPPGTDTPNQFIELRGTPNLVLSNGTYLVSIAGDTNRNPGTIKNVFDLSGRMVGGNGFLVLLQKNTLYSGHTNSTVLINTGPGPGWGSGSSSSVGHKGDNGMTDLEHASVTFFLIQAPSAPLPGSDIDLANSGVAGGPQFSSWTVLDSVSVLGNNGLGDIAYGAITFQKNPNALGSGTIVAVGFMPDYLARSSNTTGSAASDWVAGGNLLGAAPSFTLSTDCLPAGLAGAAVNHFGAPNFGALPIPGVILRQPGGSTSMSEGGTPVAYSLSLNTVPAGAVSMQIQADPQLQISTDSGSSFGSTRTLSLNDTVSKSVLVKALDDNVVDVSPDSAFIQHTIGSTADPSHYPLTSLIPTIRFDILESDVLLLNELKVNPPGTVDGPFEYVEIRGSPGALLTNVYFLAIEGNVESDPGTIKLAVNLTTNRLGTNGLLILTATNTPYAIPSQTTVVVDSRFSAPGGVLGNGTITFMLVASPSGFKDGKDLDSGDNGILEGLPAGTTVLDSVGWSDGGTNDIVYGGAALTFTPPTPDAATRFPSNNVSRSAAAWFFGDLQQTNPATLLYDSITVSSNFPYGALLTPGAVNDVSIRVTPVGPLSGVIGDPTNPAVTFTVSDDGAAPESLLVTASSSNPDVVPDSNLTVTVGSAGVRFLSINPTGVGYSTITLTITDGHSIGQLTFPYAASAMGRPNGRFHTGASDASTAYPVDSNLMFVGDDQNQSIRLYHRDQSGPAVSLFNFQNVLGLTDQEAGEVDIEASTHVGSRLYWLGSQSNNNLAQARTNRSRIFATDLSGAAEASGLAYVGRYDHLREDLVAWDLGNHHGKGSNYYGFAASVAEGVDPKTPYGFNIEGLTMAPGSSNIAWLGFRAPLVPPSARAAALLLPVTNFDVVAIGGGPPGSSRFGAPIELNLRCRGIRSIEANSNGVLICAGPPGKATGISPRDFRLFTWSGNPADTPQERGANLEGMTPEGIVEVPPSPWTPTSQVQLVSDDGNTEFYNDGIEAKHLVYPEFKKFRSDWVALGQVVVSPPACVSFLLSNGSASLTWCSVAGLTYRVQFKSNLADRDWIDLPGDVPSTGPLCSKTIPVSGAGDQRFFRVIVVL